MKETMPIPRLTPFRLARHLRTQIAVSNSFYSPYYMWAYTCIHLIASTLRSTFTSLCVARCASAPSGLPTSALLGATYFQHLGAQLYRHCDEDAALVQQFNMNMTVSDSARARSLARCQRASAGPEASRRHSGKLRQRWSVSCSHTASEPTRGRGGITSAAGERCRPRIAEPCSSYCRRRPTVSYEIPGRRDSIAHEPGNRNRVPGNITVWVLSFASPTNRLHKNRSKQRLQKPNQVRDFGAVSKN
jgi:hypothetical protein